MSVPAGLGVADESKRNAEASGLQEASVLSVRYLPYLHQPIDVLALALLAPVGACR